MKNLFIIFIALYSATGNTCTSFLVSSSQRSVMAKDFDWGYGHGLLMVNKKNVRKTATLPDKLDTPLLWTSKYGSITFNQLGRELPYGGMNEKGLSIEILWLESSQYPEPIPGIQTVNESQWIQAMLDQAATIDEMISLANGFQIHPAFAKVHYFACEASGHCAIFEYINSKLAITRLNSPKDIQIITNDSHAGSEKALQSYVGFGGEKPIPQDGSSLSRYVRGASLIKNKPHSKPLVQEAFAILDEVKDSKTQWSIVYDSQMQKIFFKSRKSPQIKEVSLSVFDYSSCTTAVKVLDMNTLLKGDVSSEFEDYSKDLNVDLVTHDLFVPEKFWKIMESAADQDNCI